MKKFYYIVGAFATAAAIFAIIAVVLRKLRISLCIEGIDDEMPEESPEHDDITLSFDETDEEEFVEPEVETVTEEE